MIMQNMDIQNLQERFEKLDWKQQLGNLASTLARVSRQASSPEYDNLVIDLLQEAAFSSSGVLLMLPRPFCWSWRLCRKKSWHGNRYGR